MNSQIPAEKPVETKPAPKDPAVYKDNVEVKPVPKMKPAAKPAPKAKDKSDDFYPTKDLAVKKVAKKSPGRPKKNPEA